MHIEREQLPHPLHTKAIDADSISVTLDFEPFLMLDDLLATGVAHDVNAQAVSGGTGD